MADLLTRVDDGGVATLTLTSPTNFKPLARGMLLALKAALADVACDLGIRVVILRAEGKTFCAGHDLKEIQAARSAPDGGAAEIADFSRFCRKLPKASRPSLTAAHRKPDPRPARHARRNSTAAISQPATAISRQLA